jgi:exodeoxyribonuclease VII large subunit
VTSRHPLAPQLDFIFEEPAPIRRIWPVRELVAQVNDLVEKGFGDVWVEGEISNFRPASSGHIYFTLKDADAQLPVVLFRRQALLLRFRPEDGLHVLVRGRAGVYQQRGQLQLVAETMEPVGAGSLQLAFEQLKGRLKAEGLFDAERKKPLPMFPRTVGIVTSPTGAVIRDFLNIVSRRHSGLNVLLFPVAVQGESAPAEIEEAIAELNGSHRADLIVLARGGGSLEDLAAFNSERVARAIASSELPVVSAVGHETDFTIADFVADLRAPTPSAAAELITEAQHTIAERLAEQANRLDRAVRFQILHARRSLADLPASRAESRIAALLYRLGQRLDDVTLRLDSAITGQLHAAQKRTNDLAATILHHDPRRNLAHAQRHLADLHTRLEHGFDRLRDASASRLAALDARLHSLSPLAVLDRGYALVRAADGSLIRSTAQLATGQQLSTRLADGAFLSRVEAVDAGTKSESQKTNRRGKKSK